MGASGCLVGSRRSAVVFPGDSHLQAHCRFRGRSWRRGTADVKNQGLKPASPKNKPHGPSALWLSKRRVVMTGGQRPVSGASPLSSTQMSSSVG